MTDLRERFRELDSLDAPEVWPAVVRRGPRPPMDLGPSPRRRAGIAFLALVIGIGGLAFVAQAFRSGSPQPVAPTSTVSNGKIAFARGSDGRWQIATINPDGTSDATLTDTPGEAFHPAWSPDGRRILFDMQASGGRMQIFVVNEDGTGLTQLTDDPGWNYLPAWSSDGSKIAFVSSRDGNDEIYVMNANGSAQTRLTDSPNGDLSPSWAPGGDRIVFQSNRDGSNEIYVMNADGSDVTRLTDDPGAFDGAPKWSPDGERIVFSSDRDGPGLYTMNPDGTGIVQLTHDKQVGPLDPAWSPDGTSIIYTTTVDGSNQLGFFVVDVEARSRQALPGVLGDVCCPSWQPALDLPVDTSASEVAANLLSPAPEPAEGYAANGVCNVGPIRADHVGANNLLRVLEPYVPTWLPPRFGLFFGFDGDGTGLENGRGAIWTDEHCRQVRLEFLPHSASSESPRPPGEWELIDNSRCTFSPLVDVPCFVYHAQDNGGVLNLYIVGLSGEDAARVAAGVQLSD
jgi:Tol biopolymer transport system component